MAKNKTTLSVKNRKPTPHPRRQQGLPQTQFVRHKATILGKRNNQDKDSHLQKRVRLGYMESPDQDQKENGERSDSDEEYEDSEGSSDRYKQNSKEEIKEPKPQNGKSHNFKLKKVPSIPSQGGQRPGVPDGTDPNNPVRVYADGVFDMFHIGHAKVLEQAKKLFPHTYLIVGVSGDKETIEKKGKIVMNEEERSEIIKHCRWADEVICPCPWIVTLDFLRANNIHYVAHDEAPYGSAGADDIYAEVKKYGMFKATQRTEGISTSDIILRIIKDYDMYIWRSLNRGYSRKDLGISAFKEQRIKFKKGIKEFSDSFQTEHFGKAFDERYEKIKSKISSFITKMEDRSEHFFFNFLQQYTKDDKSLIGKIINVIKKRDDKARLKAIQMIEQDASDFDF